MIHVVLGPPCSGKSTYVREHKKDGDIVVDFDRLAEALGNDEKHAAPSPIKEVTFIARGAAIYAICKRDYEAWIIHTKPTEFQRKLYDEAGAEYIEMETDMQTCLERCEADNRPEGTADIIRQYFEAPKGALFIPRKDRKMKIKTKTIEFKAENGRITGYAATWIREPDSYGDVIAKGAFEECIKTLKDEGKVIPLLWNHDSYDIKAYIGTVFDLEEDDKGLKFVADFDATDEAQRARELATTGRVVKFSFAYDVLDQGTVTLEDGREANELRKLNIHEVSLCLYPANPDTGIIDVKTAGKAGRRNSKADEEELRKASELLGSAQAIINGLLADEEDPEDGSKAKSEEQDTANDEEQKKREDLIKKANELLKKGE